MAEYLAVRRSLSAIVVLRRLAPRLHRHRPQAARLRRAAPRQRLGQAARAADQGRQAQPARYRRRAAGGERRPRRGRLGAKRRVARRRSRRSAAPASTTPRVCSTPGRTGAARMIETYTIALGNGIDLSCRAAGRARRPGDRLPARLSRGGLRLGRAARALLGRAIAASRPTCAATSARRRRRTSRRIAPSTWSPTSRR